MAKKEAPSILEILGKSVKNETETLAGYIQLVEKGLHDLQEEALSNDNVSTFTLRLPKALNDRFEKSCAIHNETKSKILRSLIEFYIVEVEAELKVNPIAEIFNLPASEQIERISELTEEDQLLFFKMKKQMKEKKEKEVKINSNKSQTEDDTK